MAVAALVTWILTALGGFSMLGVWISRGAPRTRESRLPAPVVFGHLLLAATGLVLRIHRARATSTAPERAIPVVAVAGHGVPAVVTLVLVLLTTVSGG
ncbi:hypothetical protein GCM10010149_32730 [Nonomuraea roseoviolacea subsp. roseoviolacea]|uniref:hypothetical protein n=1 Tax=Nonomuraea roseoviolacea TaxID=103837 RepID=UPI0031E37C1E